MNNTYIKEIAKNNILLVLSIIAFVFSATGRIIWEFNVLGFSFNPLASILSLLITLAPYILLVLLFSKLHNKIKMPIFIAMVFGLFVLYSIFKIGGFTIVDVLFLVIFAFLTFCSVYFRKDCYKIDKTIIILIVFVYLTYFCVKTCTEYFMYEIEFKYTSKFLILSILFILSTISVLNGGYKKIIVIITLLAGMTLNIYELTDYVKIGEAIKHLSAVSSITEHVGEFVLFAVLLLYILNNNLPNYIARFKNTSPEVALTLINKELKEGIITAEEYKLKRANIINSL